MRKGFFLGLLVCSAFAQTKEKPAGVVVSSDHAQVRPAHRAAPVELAANDYLFAGDTVVIPTGGSAMVSICAKGTGYALTGGHEFSITSTDIRSSSAAPLSPRAAPACDPPPTAPELASAQRRALIQPATARTDPRELPLGPTYALVVGISSYQNLEEKYWLHFADADAQSFGVFLASPRGGGLAGDDRIKILTNREATRDAVRNYIRLYLGKAQASHGTFLLLLAAHGIVDEKTRDAHIVTNDADPQDLSSSGLSMDELAEVLGEGLGGIGRMLIFVDVCHSAEIRGIRSNLKKYGVNGAIQDAIPQLPGQIFSFVSSRETEPSFEGDNWGGGHGAFTYFVLRGLNGDADKNGDGAVSAQELLDYVGNMVKETTRDEQHPKELTVTVGNLASLAEGAKTQFPDTFGVYQTVKPQDTTRNRGGARGAPPAATHPAQTAGGGIAARNDFETSLRAGKILPGEPQSAYDLLPSAFTQGSPEYRQAETELQIALENKGQQVLLEYLQGDQVAPKRDAFRDGARYFAAAQLLAPDAASVEGRRLFCEGRYAIFEKNYSDAIRLLGSAARMDPKGAYSFNALGIAYLEQSNFPLATAAFQDAIQLAPYWAYPRHNLALTLAEQGQYDSSIRAYREAIKLGPDYSYLPYNLGLLYERLNRMNDARESFEAALRVAQTARDSGLRPAAAGQWQEGSAILNALGSLDAARTGRSPRENAERLFRRALMEDTSSRPARHNLALLLSRDAPSAEAEALWRQNLSEQDDDIASRLALARYLNRTGRLEDAAGEFQVAIGPDGGYPGIRRELGAVYLKLNRPADARTVLERALQDAPQSGALLEDLGDLERASGNASKATERYGAAEAAYKLSADKARVRKKLLGK